MWTVSCGRRTSVSRNSRVIRDRGSTPAYKWSFFMKTYQIFRKLVRATGVHKVVLAFIIFFMLSAFIIMLREPQINNYNDACWYCFAVISTCGFGDIVATSFTARVVSVLLSIFAVVVIAMLTGVIVNLYTRLLERRVRGSLTDVMDRLEHLSELSKEELDDISERVRKL